MDRYNHRAVEGIWQRRWAEAKLFATPEAPRSNRKRYVLDMFPYPSGAGLHVGHPEGYTATDIVVRKLRAEGYDVLHPMGWDAFGLPAENYAIKTGTPPQVTTAGSIKRFREQIQSIGFSYDWSREVDTSDPTYYRWTQWLFLKLYERGLAYQQKAPVNWCPNDQTVLANEQVVDGRCDRCGAPVEQRNLKQWFFKITEYADELLDSLDDLDWPEPIKAMQRNWIGRKSGVTIHHRVKDLNLTIDTFSAFPAWLFADTFLVIAPEHPLVPTLASGTEQQAAVEAFIEETRRISPEDRVIDRFEKKGVFTGRSVIDPFGHGELPIWVANFVLPDFGTGIIRCSAHDVRDSAFATKYDLPLREVVERLDPTQPVKAHENSGRLVDSGHFTGREVNKRLINEMLDWIEAEGIGERTTTYRLRDWLVSRQRYWGTPIPILYCGQCGVIPVPEEQLPVVLPTDVDFRPTGESPIVRSDSFHRDVMCPVCHSSARRESDTLDTFVDSSWYFFRYTDTSNDREPFSQTRAHTWLPVDLYVGGAEHAVLHLLYARFMTKVLADLEYSNVREPFTALRNQGLVLGEDGQKMSKSRPGSVINPDDVIEEYGADTLRCYEMFMGPFEASKPWSTKSLIGIRRWLDRVWQLREKVAETEDSKSTQRVVEQAVAKVGTDIDAFKFNTAISALMIASKALAEMPRLSSTLFHRYLQLLAPFAPHLAEELFTKTGGQDFIERYPWPKVDKILLTLHSITIPVQIDGKVRTVVELPVDVSEAAAIEAAKTDIRVQKFLAQRRIRTARYVPGKIISLTTAE